MHTLSALTGEFCPSPSPPTRQNSRTVCQKHTEYYFRSFAPPARGGGAARGARGSALPFRLSMPSQTGRARVFPNRHVEILPPDLWRPPRLPRVMKRLKILFRTVSCGHTAGKRVENTENASTRRGDIPPTAPFHPRSAPGIQHFRLSFDGTFVSIAHTRTPQTTRAIQRRARQNFTAGNLPLCRKSISTRGSYSGARRLRARVCCGWKG